MMVLLLSVWYTILAFLGSRIGHFTPFTEGIVGVSCRGLHVRDGYVSCNNNGHKTSCRVKCGGRDWGLFTCSEDRGWTPGLPPCAKPSDDPDQIPGCPDDAQCSIACQQDPRFGTKGSCVGPRKAVCSCEPPRHATEQPLNAEVASCKEQGCIRWCSVFPMPMTGRCKGDACECVI